MPPLTLLDWIALAVFVGCWVVYALVVDRIPSIRARSIGCQRIAAIPEEGIRDGEVQQRGFLSLGGYRKRVGVSRFRR